jgi:acetylornithine deacetylase/succinyl-diaminopimelate desuccinylase-like protein
MNREFWEMLKMITTTPSPTFNEKRKADIMSELFSKRGLKTFIDDINNVLVCNGETLPDNAILVEAHLDTVFDESTRLDWEEQDDRIFCPSVADNSVALASLVNLAEKLDRWPRTILAATSREEVPGKGAGMKRVIEYILSSGSRLLYSISVEGVPVERITFQGIGSIRADINLSTPGGHSWIDPRSPNAVHIAAEIVSEIVKNHGFIENPRTTASIGSLRSGRLCKIGGSGASFDIDIRSVEKQSLHNVFSCCKSVIKSIAEGTGAKYDIEVSALREPSSIPSDHKLVRAVRKAHANTGIESTDFPSSTNASVPLGMGIPAVTVGITRGGGTHSPNEWISKKYVTKGIESLEHVLDILNSGGV